MSKELPKINPDDLLTPPKVAQYLGVSARTVQRYAKAGYFPNYEITPSGYRIPGSDVITYLETKKK